MDHRNDLTFKEFILVIKKEGKPTEYRNYEAYNRDYARGYADMLQISENCIVTVKLKKS